MIELYPNPFPAPVSPPDTQRGNEERRQALALLREREYEVEQCLAHINQEQLVHHGVYVLHRELAYIRACITHVSRIYEEPSDE